MSTTVFSLSAVAFLWGGQPAKGYGESNAFQITMKNPKFTTTEGVDGGVIRNYTGSKLATVKLTLLASSPYNDYLSALHDADVLSSDLGQGGVGVLPFGVKDFNGTSMASATAMWITKAPDMTRTNKLGDVEWEFEASEMRIYHGGQISV